MSSTDAAPLSPHHRAMLGLTIPEVLDAAAHRWADRLALHEVEGEQRSMSWGELSDAVKRVRSGLERLGITPGSRVGVMIRNQIEFPLIWMAIIEAGAAIVPLNPKYTAREIEFVLTDSEATWFIGLGELIDEHAAEGRLGPVTREHIVSVGSSEHAPHTLDELLSSEPMPRMHRADPRDVVNIQFTSGTTGLPKGCLLTHEYWIHLGAYGAGIDADPQRLLADHPFYYMQNQAYFMTAVMGGGALYITPGLSRRKFMGWLLDHQIDFAWIDEDLLDLEPSERDGGLALKRAPVAGLPSHAYPALLERFGITAREVYASTEVGPGTYVPYERADLAGTGSMGFCFPNRESKVIDEEFHEVSPGTPGELCFRGPGMMLGYHNRPEANTELFLPGGWFRTGDVVVKDTEGNHYYVGRLRDMIRRSGENISAAEVEMHLYAMPEIDDVAAVPVPDKDREEEVKVIVVPAAGAELDARAVVEWARKGLAPFKVPRYVEFRDELPYTASGKVHKAALRDEEPLHAAVVDTRP